MSLTSKIACFPDNADPGPFALTGNVIGTYVTIGTKMVTHKWKEGWKEG